MPPEAESTRVLLLCHAISSATNGWAGGKKNKYKAPHKRSDMHGCPDGLGGSKADEDLLKYGVHTKAQKERERHKRKHLRKQKLL